METYFYGHAKAWILSVVKRAAHVLSMAACMLAVYIAWQEKKLITARALGEITREMADFSSHKNTGALCGYVCHEPNKKHGNSIDQTTVLMVITLTVL